MCQSVKCLDSQNTQLLIFQPSFEAQVAESLCTLYRLINQRATHELWFRDSLTHFTFTTLALRCVFTSWPRPHIVWLQPQTLSNPRKCPCFKWLPAFCQITPPVSVFPDCEKRLSRRSLCWASSLSRFPLVSFLLAWHPLSVVLGWIWHFLVEAYFALFIVRLLLINRMQCSEENYCSFSQITKPSGRPVEALLMRASPLKLF